MEGTVTECMRIGYTKEQSELIGRIDDLFEEAIKINLINEDDALQLGKVFGTMAGKFTGKFT
ncbi:hypothetical protein LCGC14_1149280 [marine sediment metagenome]|uniref:Uncharacterized protein n=1 Tax=marine sediment metagenome TaxID=412755 RepID=A0A0F9Q1N9_9ZZZZ|nr:hypothetical protein [Candidatus Aminicenantes bacterium]